MDPLSHILQAARMRSPLIADLRLGTDISVGLPAFGGLPFHYVVKGGCCLDTGTERIDLMAGDFVMLARLPYYRVQTGRGARRVEIMDFAERDKFSLDELHTGRNQLLMREIGPAPMAVRVFSAILIPGDRGGSPLLRDLPVVTLLRDIRSLLEPWLVAVIDFMSAEVRDIEPGLSVIAERLIEVIFLAVLRAWLLGHEHERGWMRGLSDPTVARVLDAMHAEPGRHWTLHDLAIVAGRSRSGLAKHFREIMDETPFVYLTRWRMYLAAADIARGGRSIAEVGASVGYAGTLAFTRVFMAAFGETPAQYRRRSRKETIRRPAAPAAEAAAGPAD